MKLSRRIRKVLRFLWIPNDFKFYDILRKRKLELRERKERDEVLIKISYHKE